MTRKETILTTILAIAICIIAYFLMTAGSEAKGETTIKEQIEKLQSEIQSNTDAWNEIEEEIKGYRSMQDSLHKQNKDLRQDLQNLQNQALQELGILTGDEGFIQE